MSAKSTICAVHAHVLYLHIAGKGLRDVDAPAQDASIRQPKILLRIEPESCRPRSVPHAVVRPVTQPVVLSRRKRLLQHDRRSRNPTPGMKLRKTVLTLET